MAKERHSFKGQITKTAQKMKEKRESRSSYLNTIDGVRMLKIPENLRTLTLDFLPYIVTSENHPDHKANPAVAAVGTEWYRVPIKVHQKVGVDGEKLTCTKFFGKKCPICEYQLKRIRAGADKEEFKQLYPQDRSLYVVVPIGTDLDEVPYVWDMANFLFQDTLEEELRNNEDNSDFFTLDEGKTVELKLKWKEIGKTNYPEVVSISFLKREPYDESIMKEVPSLDEMIKILPYEEIQSKFFEVDGEETGSGKLEDVEDEKPPVRRSRPTPPPADPEPEKEEAPPVRRRAASPAPKPEPEESAPIRRKQGEEEAPKRQRAAAPAPAESGNKCPHGYVFGQDTDSFPACDKCTIWDECIDKKEKRRN